MSSSSKIALVHDRLNVRGGAERVLEELCAMYPTAPIYTLIYDPKVFADSPITQHEVRASVLSSLPGAARHHRIYIPIMPTVMESFKLDEFDILLSSSAAFAHGIKTRQDQLHVSYIHSPMRYVWHQYKEHTTRLGYGSLPIKVLLAYLRKWDRRAAQRANHMVTNSQWTAAKIREAFGREATVIHPPVHVERFHPVQSKGDYFLTVCRLVPYKRVDLIVKAFNRLKLPLVVVGDGSEFSKLYKLAQPNVTLLPYQVQEDLNKLMANAKAFVYAAEEDFGIAAVEAQAAGCPVIAFGRGGLTETVVEGVSGIFYDEQSVDAIVTAIEVFQKREKDFQTAAITKNAERFSAERFVNSFSEFMNEKIAGRAA